MIGLLLLCGSAGYESPITNHESRFSKGLGFGSSRHNAAAINMTIEKAICSIKKVSVSINIDGIQDICRVLGVDWQRFILGL